MSTGAPQDGVSFVIPVFTKRRLVRQVAAALAAPCGLFARWSIRRSQPIAR